MDHLRRLLCLLIVMAGTGISPALAEEDPAAVIRELYRVHGEAEKTKQPAWLPPHQSRFFAQRLARLINRAYQRNEIGFDFIYDGQDYKISDLRIQALGQSSGAAMVEARFKNFDVQKNLRYRLRREDNTWKITDISARGSNGWRLRKLLEDK